MAKGHDPAQVRQEKRRREQATLGLLLAEDGPYETSLTSRHIVKRREVLSSLRRGLARFANVDVAKLSRREFVEALDALNDLPGAKDDLRKHSRVLLDWCVNAGLAHANVLAGMRLPPKTRVEKLQAASRRRALSDDDIIKVWHAAKTSGRPGAFVQLLLLTAMRRNELATLRWSDLAADRITLSAMVTKTSTKHEIPLTPLMWSILNQQPRTTSPYVFPSYRTGRPSLEWNTMKMPIMRAARVGQWTLHDLRRSCRTLMSRCGVPEPAAELAIGHVKATLVGLYNLDEQWAARVDAFTRVSNHIGKLVARRIQNN